MTREYPEVVVLHDTDHDDYPLALMDLELALEKPYLVRGFTDHINSNNTYNKSLGKVAEHCKVLVVQAELLQPPTTSARVALRSYFDAANNGEIFVFDDSYRSSESSFEERS